MKAAIIKRFGGPENIELADLPTPTPGPGEVLVRVRATALNHLDVWVRNGIPAYKISLPHVLGSDVAGEVEALGPLVKSVRVGSRVSVAPGRSCWGCEYCLGGRDNYCAEYGIIGAHGGPGGYAEYLCVPQMYLLPAPDSMSFEEAAAYPLTMLSAWHMLVELGRVGAGQVVVVMGAGAGMGAAAIQVAKFAGARVIAVSTSPDKLEKAKALGADDAVACPPGDIVRQVAAFTGGAMADIVVEHVGPAVFESALRALKRGGRLVTCGATTGPTVSLDLRLVFSRQLHIRGSYMGSLRAMRLVSRLVGEGRLRPVIDRTFPLSQARAAHEYLESRKQFGKVVLKV
ncbi:MAG: zinc-binding dehydrogenase [Elusimicrobia bacterium]|nr:zinc-binding dehydrogenase [Elusimicrobiota bacterium]